MDWLNLYQNKTPIRHTRYTAHSSPLITIMTASHPAVLSSAIGIFLFSSSWHTLKSIRLAGGGIRQVIRAF